MPRKQFKNKNKKKNKANRQPIESNEQTTNKNKLRSTLDAYNRLLHDKTLPFDRHDVWIGYNDNIYGLQQMPLLQWTMIDKGGDIPMHHIINFQANLKDGSCLIIWDKQTKLDRLFGSGITKTEETLKHIFAVPPLIRLLDEAIQYIESFDDEIKQPMDDEKYEYPQLLVGRAVRNKNKFVHSKMCKKHKLIAPLSVFVHKWGALSPFHLKDKDDRLIENVWQFSKVYKTIAEQKQVKYGKEKWIYKNVENCINEKDGSLTDEYWQWQKTGMNHVKAVRFPVGRYHRNECLYSVMVDDDGKLQKLDYIEARKKIYVPIYIKSLIRHKKYKELKKMYENGQNLLISEFDGPVFESANYYKETYGNSIVLNGGLVIPNKQNLKILLNDPKHPFGHGYCIAMALQHIKIDDLL